MAFDSSGTFTRAIGPTTGAAIWQGDAAAGTKILASRHDTHDQDIASGLSQCLTRHGWGVPSVDIPWGGKKITNLAPPTQPQDAATKDYVDKLPGWETAKNISGADLNGRLNFTGPTGTNGITWTYADVSWIARAAVPSKYGNRLAMNNSVAPNTTGDPVGDVFFIDDGGRINNSGALTHNLSWDGSAWRAISPGTGTKLTYISGIFTLSANDVATITNPYAVATQRDFFQVTNTAGTVTLDLNKSASGKFATIRSYTGTELRWAMHLGYNDPEGTGATRTGSTFYLQSYDNSGANPVNEIAINRSTHDVTFAGDVYSAAQFNSKSTTAVVSAASGGQIAFRPNGPTSTTEQMLLNTVGDLQVANDIYAGIAGITSYGVFGGAGFRMKAGQTATSYPALWFNSYWNGSTLTLYANTSTLGQVAWQCDHRIKKDVRPLGSMWEAVKALNPIRYTQKAYEVWTEDDTERWGFMAHEVQEKLTKSAASGEKDGPEVQSPNLLVIIAGLTKALQEAMARIEKLEAA